MPDLKFKLELASYAAIDLISRLTDAHKTADSVAGMVLFPLLGEARHIKHTLEQLESAQKAAKVESKEP